MPALNYDNFMQPMKGQAAFSLKNKLDEYKRLYFELYAKELLVSCVYNKRYDRYTFFFKLPSAENDKYPTAIMYDIVIEFDPNKNKKEDNKDNDKDNNNNNNEEKPFTEETSQKATPSYNSDFF